MELLDDNFETGSQLTKESIQEVYKLRQEHSKARKAINNARIALAIICALSIFSIIAIFNVTSDPIVIGVTLGLILIFGICAAIPLLYARISLPIALGLYLINLISSFFTDPLLAFFGLFIKGIFIYFIVVGMIAAFKFPDILKKMERLKIIPYKY